MRREFLKGYILSLVADGTLQGLSSPIEVIKKASKTFSEDVKETIGDIMLTMAEQTAQREGGFVWEKIGAVVSDIRKRGARKVWQDLQAQYAKGMEGYGK